MYFSTERSRSTYIDANFDGESIFNIYIMFWKVFGLKNTKNEKYLAGKIIFDLDFAGDPSILGEIRSIL